MALRRKIEARRIQEKQLFGDLSVRSIDPYFARMGAGTLAAEGREVNDCLSLSLFHLVMMAAPAL